jgi:hypothetical protein
MVPITALHELESQARHDVEQRRALGDYDVSAGIIRRIAERQLEIIGYLIELNQASTRAAARKLK